MNIIEKTLVFYVVVVLVMLYFLSGVRLPWGRVIYRIKPLRERMVRRARERKINAKIVRLVFPRRPKSLSEILLVSILYLFLGYLILSKIFFFAVVMSDSMRPTFEKGDLVLVQTLSKEP
ncbi:S24/S26 family peptidase, partial [Candidatus Pyrohabitans sp.]